MRATWYVLEDGTAVDPAECSPDDKGVALTHKSGAKVAMRNFDMPMSRGVDIDEATGKLLFAGKGDHDGNGTAGGAKPVGKSPLQEAAEALSTSAATDREIKPEPKPKVARKPGYQTRKAK